MSLAACANTGTLSSTDPAPQWTAADAATIAAWPARRATPANGPLNATQEARIARIVAGMTLEQKIGQMTQPEIRWITPDEVRQYYIGTILNGGGSWPQMNKHAALSDWTKLSRPPTRRQRLPATWRRRSP